MKIIKMIIGWNRRQAERLRASDGAWSSDYERTNARPPR